MSITNDFNNYWGDKVGNTLKNLQVEGKTAIVDSIYMKNSRYRDDALRHIWDKYNMLPSALTNSISKLYNLVREVYIPPKNMKNLFDYTHDGSSVYSQRIREKFLTAGPRSNEKEFLTSIPKGGYFAWGGKYEDEKGDRNYARFYNRTIGIHGSTLDFIADSNIRSAIQGNVWSSKGYNEENMSFDSNINVVDTNTKSELLKKTQQLYNELKIKTLSSRFYTGKNDSKIEFIDTAKTRVGNSHGKNLLKKGMYTSNSSQKVNGYDNPYSRVWTHHNQYSRYKDILRSGSWIKENEMLLTISHFNHEKMSHSVIDKSSGLVRITPRSKDDIKKCMFSITNLAKEDGTTNRTMWFPPYDLKFQETVTVEWDEKKFIGRGEPIYSYVNTKRSGTLSFTILVDHPVSLNNMGVDTLSNGEDYENEILRFFAGDGKIEINKVITKQDVITQDVVYGYKVTKTTTDKQTMGEGWKDENDHAYDTESGMGHEDLEDDDSIYKAILGKAYEIKYEKGDDIDNGYNVSNEYEFFRDITENDKFTYDKIKNKIRLFHPAYHSISPEGFNMRLNFLHQCTRQGPTIGNDNVAGNSVFGKSPFCELRIGDFINTTIVIQSLSITYENEGGIQWDLNAEGIGVQPMFANISMSIDIIGGQSLDGPILMLNNAVSNNFYANTGIYHTYDDNDGIFEE